MSPEGLSRLLAGWSRGITREFGAGVAVDDRSPEATGQAMRDGIDDGYANLARADLSDIDTVCGVYDTGHDPSGSVTVCADGTGGTVGRFERTTRARGESVADGAFRSRRTPALEPPREGARHATGQVPAIGGVTR